VNNNQFYDRRDDRTLSEPSSVQPPIEEATAALAVHRDPSIPTSASGAEAKPPAPGVAWVRPTELPTLIGSPWIRRGIDLQSELVRRSRRAPLSATRAGRRISRAAIAQPATATPTAASIEELGL
jgi:hypothetical protein